MKAVFSNSCVRPFLKPLGTAILSHQKSLGTGMGGQSVEDLERVIAAMRRVVERLQGENDHLKKTVGAGGPQYGEVLKENKRLKVRRVL